MADKKNIVLAVSSTGGHLYPALRVAEELRQDERAEVFLAGPDRELARRIAAGAGLEYLSLPATGWGGGLSRRGARNLFSLMRSFPAAFKILRQTRAAAVMSVGSYSALPLVWAARRKKIPLLIFEPNVIPGKINRLTGRWAAKIALAWPQTAAFFPAAKCLVVGMPLRRDFFRLTAAEARSFWGIEAGKKVIVVFGGSQGAEVLNQALLETAPRILADPEVLIIHLSGAQESKSAAARLVQDGIAWQKLGPGAARSANYLLAPYCDDMPRLILASDLVVSRAGALSVGEIAAAGKSAVFVPFGRAAEQHQVRNAEVLAQTGQAEIILEKDLTAERLLGAIKKNLDQASQQDLAAGPGRDFSGSAARLADLVMELAGHEQ